MNESGVYLSKHLSIIDRKSCSDIIECLKQNNISLSDLPINLREHLINLDSSAFSIMSSDDQKKWLLANCHDYDKIYSVLSHVVPNTYDDMRKYCDIALKQSINSENYPNTLLIAQALKSIEYDAGAYGRSNY